MYEYGYMPNFPRYYSITLKEYDQSNIFLRYRHITIKIKDCDGDDPQYPCPDAPSYLIVDEGGNAIVDHPQALNNMKRVAAVNGNNVALLRTIDADTGYKFSVYDISGRTVKSGNLNDGYDLNDLPYSGVFIFHVYDEHG
jgi:hypothetical protein